MDSDRIGWDIVVERAVGAAPQLIGVLARDVSLVIEFEVVDDAKTCPRPWREWAIGYVMLHIAHKSEVSNGVVNYPVRPRPAANERDAVQTVALEHLEVCLLNLLLIAIEDPSCWQLPYDLPRLQSDRLINVNWILIVRMLVDYPQVPLDDLVGSQA
jgi:hypothetical protein